MREVLDELPGGLALQADVSDGNRARSVIAEVTKDIGPIDVLINNAGVGGGAKGASRGEQEEVQVVKRCLRGRGYNVLN